MKLPFTAAELTFAVEPCATAHALRQGFARSPGAAVLVLGRMTWVLTWPVYARR